jgi:hypothetical protein
MKTTIEIIKSALVRATTINTSTISSLGDYESQSSQMVREAMYGKCVDMLKGTGLSMLDKIVSEKQLHFYACKINETNNDATQQFIASENDFAAREERKSAEKQDRMKAHATTMRDVATEVAKELGITKKALMEGIKGDKQVSNDLRFKGKFNIEQIKNILGI